MDKKSLILIGMPGSGKSFFGRRISTELGLTWIDTDRVFQSYAGFMPAEFVKSTSRENFEEVQEKAILESSFRASVVSSGGGVVVNPKIMNYLSQFGVILYLEEEFDVLYQRLKEGRSIEKEEKSFQVLFQIRKPMYEKYAQITVSKKGKDEKTILQEMIFQFQEYSKNNSL
jgi:shikimate kinase